MLELHLLFMSVETTVIEGKYTDAIVFLPEEEIEENAYNQIQTMVNHPAFQNKVRIMPDTHYGAGAVIGFTAPVSNMVIPNVVGVDLGCGMYAFKLSNVDLDLSDESVLEQVDKDIRSRVPMGQSVNSEEVYHMKNDMPWSEIDSNWKNFALNYLDNIPLGEYHPDEFNYDIDYFKELCYKIGEDINRAIAACGSNGGGNHMVELCRDSNGDIWCVIHSGSRGLGYKTAEYHQGRAVDIRTNDGIRKALSNLVSDYGEYVKPDVDSVSNGELHEWIHNKQIVDYDRLKEDYKDTEDAYLIEEISNVINGVSRGQFNKYEEYIESITSEELDAMSGSEDLAYLDGEEAIEYYVDMAFAQMYASESRKEMARRVADVLGAEIVDEIESVHNYIDYEDGIMRKGATPAREGQRAIIPMNMAYGSLLVRGKGNEEANYSAPHGAGRVMSRTRAKNELSEEEFREQMSDTFASSLPLDEAPNSYKDVDMIRKAMEPMVEIEDHLKPILSMKAND